MIETAAKEDLLLPILQKLVETVEEIQKHQKSQFALVQQQLSMIEPQLNTMTIWASRAYTANLDPVARNVAMEEAKKLAEEQQKQMEEEEQAILKARADRGVPDGGNAITPEDIAEWRDDRER